MKQRDREELILCVRFKNGGIQQNIKSSMLKFKRKSKIRIAGVNVLTQNPVEEAYLMQLVRVQVGSLTKLWRCAIKTQRHLTSSKERKLRANASHLMWKQSSKISRKRGGKKIQIMLHKAPFSMTLTKRSSTKHNQRANHRMAALVQHPCRTMPMFT